MLATIEARIERANESTRRTASLGLLFMVLLSLTLRSPQSAVIF